MVDTRESSIKRNFQVEDAGEWTCQAENRFGKISHTFNVEIPTEIQEIEKVQLLNFLFKLGGQTEVRNLQFKVNV